MYNPFVLTIPLKVLALSVLVALSSCERDTQVTMNTENPPTFVLSGSGSLGMLRVHGPRMRPGGGESPAINWEIQPKGGIFAGTKVAGLSVSYGKIPPNYVQIYPERGPAPPLIEGEEYDVFFDTTGANGSRKYFVIRGGKAVEQTENKFGGPEPSP